MKRNQRPDSFFRRLVEKLPFNSLNFNELKKNKIGEKVTLFSFRYFQPFNAVKSVNSLFHRDGNLVIIQEMDKKSILLNNLLILEDSSIPNSGFIYLKYRGGCADQRDLKKVTKIISKKTKEDSYFQKNRKKFFYIIGPALGIATVAATYYVLFNTETGTKLVQLTQENFSRIKETVYSSFFKNEKDDFLTLFNLLKTRMEAVPPTPQQRIEEIKAAHQKRGERKTQLQKSIKERVERIERINEKIQQRKKYEQDFQALKEKNRLKTEEFKRKERLKYGRELDHTKFNPPGENLVPEAILPPIIGGNNTFGRNNTINNTIYGIPVTEIHPLFIPYLFGP